MLAPSDPLDEPSYVKPCVPTAQNEAVCSPLAVSNSYYQNRLRHQPEPGQSVLADPGEHRARRSSRARTGSRSSSFRPERRGGLGDPPRHRGDEDGQRGQPRPPLPLPDLEEHPCASAFGDTRLDAAHAQAATFFQADFLDDLRTIFAGGGIALGSTTYEDVTSHPDLDGLDVGDAGALLALGTHASGINVFFVRTLSPVGLQAFGPNPGPAGLARTRQSGIVIGIDTLCYRSWSQLARLTAHELARYMGLYHNVELEVGQHPTWRDPIADSDDSSSNLMFFSELGGTVLSPGQREILDQERGAAMKRVAIALGCWLGLALPSRGDVVQLTQPVINALTPIDSLPSTLPARCGAWRGPGGAREPPADRARRGRGRSRRPAPRGPASCRSTARPPCTTAHEVHVTLAAVATTPRYRDSRRGTDLLILRAALEALGAAAHPRGRGDLWLRSSSTPAGTSGRRPPTPSAISATRRRSCRYGLATSRSRCPRSGSRSPMRCGSSTSRSHDLA